MTEVAEAWKINMEKITCTIVEHRGETCIGLHFPFNQHIQAQLKKSSGILWSRTHQCWYMRKDAHVFFQLQQLLEGKAYFEDSDGNAFLCEEKKEKNRSQLIDENNQINQSSQDRVAKLTTVLSQENMDALKLYRRELILKSYSASTLRTYINEFRSFLQTIRHYPAKNFTSHRMKDYLQYCFDTLKLSENTLHSRINALKFYYEQVLGREKFFWEIPRPKKHLILPKVLGEEELRRLFAAVNNLKHKAILFTAYSAGLRVSEVINLRFEDIDRERKQLFVYCSKGKKDRYVALSPLLLDVLESYYKMWKPRPIHYVFEGDVPGERYSIRSAQIIFHNAKQKAGIHKTISFHGLRHSFATHLLEKGVDVKYIKEILGHFNIKTTERYLHVKRESLVNIISPLDILYSGKQ